jgi:hypothetical protein
MNLALVALEVGGWVGGGGGGGGWWLGGGVNPALVHCNKAVTQHVWIALCASGCARQQCSVSGND